MIFLCVSMWRIQWILMLQDLHFSHIIKFKDTASFEFHFWTSKVFFTGLGKLNLQISSSLFFAAAKDASKNEACYKKGQY